MRPWRSDRKVLMVKNFIPSCDWCGTEIPFERRAIRRVPCDGVELLMVALYNSDPDFEFIRNPDGTVDLDACFDCYTRLALHPSQSVN